MKKNLITVIILALVFVNLILTIMLTVTVMPEAKKANELISKVCNAIDLDLQAGDASGAIKVAASDLKFYNVPESITVGLAKSSDGVQHYVVINVSLSLDSTHKDYKGGTWTETTLSPYDTMIRSAIIEVVSRHTIQDFEVDRPLIQDEILEALQTQFATSAIVSVGFSGVTYQ